MMTYDSPGGSMVQHLAILPFTKLLWFLFVYEPAQNRQIIRDRQTEGRALHLMHARPYNEVLCGSWL